MIRYNDYIIEPNDCGGWVLKEESETINKKTGKNYAYAICYPSTLKGCLKKILELEFSKVVEAKDLDLKQALVELERINKELTEFLNNNIKEEIE